MWQEISNMGKNQSSQSVLIVMIAVLHSPASLIKDVPGLLCSSYLFKLIIYHYYYDDDARNITEIKSKIIHM